MTQNKMPLLSEGAFFLTAGQAHTEMSSVFLLFRVKEALFERGGKAGQALYVRGDYDFVALPLAAAAKA